MPLMRHLSYGEEIVAQAQGFYATTSRVIRYQETEDGQESVRSLPYSSLETVRVVRKPRYKYLLLGGAMAVLSAPMFYWLVISGTVMLIVGLALAVYSLKEYEAYYQLHARHMTTEEFELWRIPREGSGLLVAEIRRIIGDQIED